MPRSLQEERSRRPGMREVAQQAGVAISSVSRVLSGHPDVSADMRDRVMAVVDELGYHPDMLAQGLRRQTTMSIGFAASTISNPVLTDAVIGAEGELRRAGYSLLLTDADGDPELDVANIELLQRRRVDAILLAHGDERHPAVRAAIEGAEVPRVLIDRDGPKGSKLPIVKFDHRRGMREAATHLRDLGHKDIAMLVGGPRRPARERRAGVLDVFGKKGSGLCCEVLEGDFSIAFGYAATKELLAAPKRPTALIAGGNVLMHGSLRALREAGVHVGPELSFVGCDDVAVAEFHDPQIAMVRRVPRDAGVAAARLLVDLLVNEIPPQDVTLPTSFAPGASCAKPRR
jgi:LacI family transcriptional regulator